jgi:hypothetical protein
LLEGDVEGAVGTVGHRVRDRPVSPSFLAELFVGAVADGDDEVTCTTLGVECSRLRVGQLDAVAFGGRPGLGVDLGPGWVPAEAAVMLLVCRQSAAARWDRAVLAVQTNNTRCGVLIRDARPAASM